MKKSGIIIIFLLAIIILLLNQGCEKWLKSDSEGRLVVSITDDPFNIDLIESATVTIDSIQVRREGVNDTIPFLTIIANPVTVDLIELRNGVTDELIQANIPVGNYDQIRLVTSEASLKMKDGNLYNLKIPSGSHTGIKITVKPPITVAGGLTSELLLDFDLSKSFILKGNTHIPDGINGFNFKPVVRAVNRSLTGSITGKVTDITQNILVNASVLVIKDTVLATAFTDTLGKYMFAGIPPGTYKMQAAKEAFDTLLFEGVRVVAGSVTTRNFSLKPE